MPSVIAITLNDDDTVTVAFDGSATYAAGTIAFRGARIPHSANATDRRSFTTSGAPTAGDGTSSHTYAIQQKLQAAEAAFRAWAGEVFETTVPAGFVSGQAEDTTIVPTNNSTEDGSPMVRVALFDTRFYTADDLTAGKLTVRVEAHGFGGAGAGVSAVSVEADDGVNTAVAAATYTTYATPDGGTWRGWVAEVDMSAIDDGTVTITATATSNAGLGDGTASVDILFDGGGTLASQTYYIDGVSGNNANAGTTSGAPLLNIGGAINKARLAGLDYTVFRFITAGNYGSRDGDGGVAFSGIVKCQADVAGVVLTASVSNQIAIRCNAFWATSSDPSSHTIKMKMVGTTSNKTAQCSNSFYADHGCLITQDDPFTNDTAVTPYPFRGDLRVHLHGAKMEDMLAGGADAGATREGGNIQGWHVRAARLTADPFNNFTTLVDCSCDDLGIGQEAATITYTGSAAATVTKTGTFETGTRTLVLKEDGVEVLNITISDAAYDTWAEVKVAVDAVTDWSLTINGSPINQPPTMAPFTDEPVGSGGTVLYSRDAFHSDLYQIFHSEARSVYINGLRCNRADRLGEGAGNYGEQTFWFDHQGPLNLNRVMVLNVYDNQIIGTAQTPQVRAGLHGVIRNALFAFITSPDGRCQLNYDGGITSGSEFQPCNFTIAYTVWRNLESSNGTDDGSDCTIFENHDFNSSAFQRITGDGQTTGTIAAALTAYAGLDTTDDIDLAPAASGPLTDRVSASGVADATGDARTASIGAEEVPAEVALSATPSVGSSASGFPIDDSAWPGDGSAATTGNTGFAAIVGTWVHGTDADGKYVQDSSGTAGSHYIDIAALATAAALLADGGSAELVIPMKLVTGGAAPSALTSTLTWFSQDTLTVRYVATDHDPVTGYRTENADGEPPALRMYGNNNTRADGSFMLIPTNTLFEYRCRVEQVSSSSFNVYHFVNKELVAWTEGTDLGTSGSNKGRFVRIRSLGWNGAGILPRYYAPDLKVNADTPAAAISTNSEHFRSIPLPVCDGHGMYEVSGSGITYNKTPDRLETSGGLAASAGSPQTRQPLIRMPSGAVLQTYHELGAPPANAAGGFVLRLPFVRMTAGTGTFTVHVRSAGTESSLLGFRLSSSGTVQQTSGTYPYLWVNVTDEGGAAMTWTADKVYEIAVHFAAGVKPTIALHNRTDSITAAQTLTAGRLTQASASGVPASLGDLRLESAGTGNTDVATPTLQTYQWMSGFSSFVHATGNYWGGWNRILGQAADRGQDIGWGNDIPGFEPTAEYVDNCSGIGRSGADLADFEANNPAWGDLLPLMPAARIVAFESIINHLAAQRQNGDAAINTARDQAIADMQALIDACKASDVRLDFVTQWPNPDNLDGASDDSPGDSNSIELPPAIGAAVTAYCAAVVEHIAAQNRRDLFTVADITEGRSEGDFYTHGSGTGDVVHYNDSGEQIAYEGGLSLRSPVGGIVVRMDRGRSRADLTGRP